jgi:hypothetical protein
VQNIDSIHKLNRIDRPIGVRIIVFNEFQDPSAFESFEGFGVCRLSAELNLIEFMTYLSPDFFRKFSKLPLT